MRSFETTRGTVTGREVGLSPGATKREALWGKGGSYRPVVTYTYVVDGVTYTSDRWRYVTEGLKRRVAEEVIAAVPDVVDVHYDPAAPQQAYLHLHQPRIGYVLIVGGVIGALAGIAVLLG